jgi:predicted DNA-binding transcriptional regulator AlpA
MAEIKIMRDGLPEYGLLRASQICRVAPFSRSHFYALVNERSVPSRKISPRVVVYDVADIRRLILRGADENP